MRLYSRTTVASVCILVAFPAYLIALQLPGTDNACLVRITVRAGQPLRFLCTIRSPNAALRWFFNEYEIPAIEPSADLYRYKITHGTLTNAGAVYSILDMGNASGFHSGLYTCSVTMQPGYTRNQSRQVNVISSTRSRCYSKAPRDRLIRPVSKLWDDRCDNDEECARVDVASLCHRETCICAPGYNLENDTCNKWAKAGERCGQQTICRGSRLQCKHGTCRCTSGEPQPSGDCDERPTLSFKIMLYIAIGAVLVAMLLTVAFYYFGGAWYHKDEFEGVFHFKCVKCTIL